ncbi:cysteine synthase A [Pseudoxanthomonas sp. SGNA-20]|jgi:Cysteine synthase|uniref:cysteine synthase n=1 Tax=Pseudoxanthomonas taiwanensis J19 TaxID=935569 RepID=A0A562E229_9GAMM|nr:MULTISPECIES: cysteine synthase A [Pseudoxanthomonas]RRN55549.1 cysteine synthase A [Pseudoxanthomonas sp. SGNA-20]RRN79485.1 cysteine synthase A [Pseudoxanthomonas sp. SGD-10]TWH16062.1 cysteine synthase A [Pseudoxanthomonas taiwanensis J19]
MRTCTDLAAAIGHTPLIRLRRASELTGCEILGKAEFLNPGGSVKDRTALGLLLDAERSGALRPGATIVEGTAGNTGIGLALLGASRGYRTIITMPATQSREKIEALRVTGAEVRLVPAVPYANPEHYAHQARRLVERMNAGAPGSAWFANQFDNTANRDFHQATTGVEIWEQTGGRIDGFVCATGTGGTLAGVGRALKARKPGVAIALADPAGSALASYVNTGELTSEGGSITEGIGSSRITANFRDAPVDYAWSIPDSESLPWVHELMAHEGLGVGGSSGVNIAGAVRLARELGPGHTIVTVLADGATRYQGKLFNPAFLRGKGLPVPEWLERAFPEPA